MTRTPPYELTAEQQEALRLYRTGRSLKLQAGAGAAKTTTLVEMAYDRPAVTVQYMAFNASIVEDASTKFPSNVSCKTIHKLAMRAVGYQYADRLPTVRMRSTDIATRLGLEPLYITLPETGQQRRLGAAYLAGLVMRTIGRFCQSADAAPADQHVPYVKGIDVPPGDMTNNRLVRQHIRAAVQRAWADLSDPQGELPYKHAQYLKMWQLGNPVINTQAIFVDEAQDLAPVMVDIVAQQAARGVQVVWVGDSQQQIYSFTGAINALETMAADHTGYLTHSFRFGPQVAAVANHMLGELDAALRLVGAGPASTVAALDAPDCVLTRTNAEAVQRMLAYMADSKRVHLIGGRGERGKRSELQSFMDGALNLQRDGWCSHPDLACFSSWDEVQRYVEQDEQGEDLRLLVKLIDQFGAQAILAALDNMPSEADADVVVSTAHKVKGREWNTVQLASDFTAEAPEGEELRLLYVAVTRARLQLDITRVPYLVAAGLAGDGTVVVEPVAVPVPVQPDPPVAVVQATDTAQLLGGALDLLKQGLALLPTNQPGTAKWREQVLVLLTAQKAAAGADVVPAPVPTPMAVAAALAPRSDTDVAVQAHPDDDISMALPQPRSCPDDMREAQRALVDQAIGAGDMQLARALQVLREQGPQPAAAATFVDDGRPF